MGQTSYDAIIIGGGPGGSAAATYLARAGKKVLVLEKEHFPRFHIGESLLPYNRTIFAEIGVLPKLEKAGLITKWGAQFQLGNGAKSLKLIFRRGKFTREPSAFQVERSEFDKLLLDHARESGAEVREGCAVTSYAVGAEEVRVEATEEGQGVRSFTGKFLIDASGRGNFTGNVEKLREGHPSLRKIAIFGHFHGVHLDDGESRGDTVIVRLENKWFWVIPITAEKTSVGCVMDADEFARLKQPPETVFYSIVASSRALRERMDAARAVGPIQTAGDFSYLNRRLSSARLLRVGDAAGFMDPIFSAGVYLAMYSGKLAAEKIGESLAAGDNGEKRFRAYDKRVLKSMRLYWRMVEAYYTTPFMELFMEPRDKFDLPAAITAVLAGEVEGGWRIRWRIWVFFAFIRLQGRLPLVPRINFAELPEGTVKPQVLYAEK